MISIAETQRDLLSRIHTEGVLVAYEAAVAVARDTKAAPAARAAASATLFRVAGYFDRAAAAERDIQPHEMTPEQLNTELARLHGRLEKPTDDIFS